MTGIKNIFLDRDGTLIADKHYLCEPEQVEILPGVIAGLARLRDLGCDFYLVSNQSGIGRGYFSKEQADAVNARLFELLAAHGLLIADSLYCPCDPKADCACRKPKTGMWKELRDKHALDPGACLMIGDKLADVRFGQNAGFAASCLVLSGYGRESAAELGWDIGSVQNTPFSIRTSRETEPTELVLAGDLAGAADYIEARAKIS